MAITDLIDRVTDSTTGRPVTTSLAGPKALAAASITLDDATNWTTTTAIHFAIYEVNANGVKDSSTQTDWKGTLAGTTISNMTLTGGTDRAYTTGAIVELTPTSRYAKDLYDWAMTHADQDGTLKAGAVDSAAVLASNVVTNAKIIDSAVTTAKLDLTTSTNTVLTNQTTTSTSFADLATVGPSVTVTVGPSGKALVQIATTMFSTQTAMGFAISGATTVAANDLNSLLINATARLSGTFLVTGLNPGSTTFTAKYKVNSGTGNFVDRLMTVVAI